jgi:EmrB/QacA subfamily drug resistance transporter
MALLTLPRAVSQQAAPAAAPSPLAIVLVVMLGNFLGPLYSATANVALPNLVASFGSDIDTIEWVVTGYMLGYSITMPLAGWLADTYGRKRMFMLGLAIFTLFSVLASLAWDDTSLIAFRIVQAVGGGIVSPTGMAIITDVIPPAQRGRALGLWGMGMMLAPAFGPWISGLLIDHLDDWRPIFWLGVPIGIAALVSAWRILPSSKEGVRNVRAAFDYQGFASLSIALTCFLVPLTQGNRLGWDDPWIVRSFIASAFVFAYFISRELHCSNPMIDVRLFTNRTFSIAIVLRSALGMGYYLSIFLLPLFTQSVLGWDPTEAGLILIPGGIVMAILMPISGTIADAFGPRIIVFAGMAWAVIGTFLFCHIDLDWEMSRISLDNALRSIALGLLFTPITAAAMSGAPRNRLGAASGILNTVWQVGGSLGIAIGQAYLTAQTSIRYVDVAASLNGARIPVQQALQHLSLIQLSVTAMQTATVRAYGDTFLLSAILLAFAVPLTLLLPHRRR